MTRKKPTCSGCGGLGHTIRSCKSESAAKVKEKKALDPVFQEKKAKNERAKEQKLQEEKQRLKLTNNAMPLHQHQILPGHVQESLGSNCCSVSGAIYTNIPLEFQKKLLEIMNKNK